MARYDPAKSPEVPDVDENSGWDDPILNAPDIGDDGEVDVEHYPWPGGEGIDDPVLKAAWDGAKRILENGEPLDEEDEEATVSNTHEYTFFDRAKLDRALGLKWSAFDKSYPGWGQWESAKQFLTDWAIELPEDAVDRLLATKTVRATMRSAEDQFHFLWGILDAKQLHAGGTDIPKGEFEYADQIVSCASAAFTRGELTLAGLTAVYQLHASWVGPLKGVPRKIARAVMSPPTPMFPDMPDLAPPGGDALGVVHTRLFFDFLRRAWKGQWPIHQDGETIRSCGIAAALVESLKGKRLVRPCVYRWYSC